MKFFQHLKTICRHRRQVRKNCFKVGLIRQGLFHDLSKFSPSEFIPGVKFWQGTRSPQAKEREVIGYSAAWLHHKGRNKHHFEYWTDLDKSGCIKPVDMPPEYFAEMVCDRVGASKVYKGKNYTDACPLEYYKGRKDNLVMHPDTAVRLEYYLQLLADKGEKVMFTELKKYVKENKKKRK